jgi:hypothetical protein
MNRKIKIWKKLPGKQVTFEFVKGQKAEHQKVP